MSSSLKRIFTDIAGYGLIFLGGALGWLPGPGGIPLVLAGLALLSLHNEWARRLSDWLIKHSGHLIVYIFPKNKYVQLFYDVIAGALFVIVAWLTWHESAVWQIGLASALFIFMIIILAINRDRAARIKRRVNRSK